MAEGTQRVRLGFGRVNLSGQGATFAALRLRPAFVRESAVDTGVREVGSFTSSPVSRNPDINGRMNTDFAKHPNGTIVMLQASWTRGGVKFREGCVLLRLRQEAAMLNVIARLPVGRETVLGDQYSIFQGHADILSVDELAVHKIAIPKSFVDRFFDMEEIDECFDIEEIIPERTARPAMSLVSTSQGIVTMETVTAPVRRMRFRKPQHGAEE